MRRRGIDIMEDPTRKFIHSISEKELEHTKGIPTEIKNLTSQGNIDGAFDLFTEALLKMEEGVEKGDKSTAKRNEIAKKMFFDTVQSSITRLKEGEGSNSEIVTNADKFLERINHFNLEKTTELEQP